MSFFFIVIAAFSIGLALQRAPQPYAPPDTSQCSLAHGFVIGEAPSFPGTVEIWKCSAQTLVVLNQMEGLGSERHAQARSHFVPAVGPGEQLMGCRGFDEHYEGIVALASSAGTSNQQLLRAWRADLDKWVFVGTSPDGIVCNRGLAVD